MVLPTHETNYDFDDFDLQGLDNIYYQPVSKEILLQHLGDNMAKEIRLEDYVVRNLMLARILEQDASVLKWMKPASGKFTIEYQRGERYEPDFVVETQTCCLLIEPKRQDDMQDETVINKQRAALRWCQYANEHAEKTGAKQWRYLLIPHNEILANNSLDGLIARFSRGTPE